MANQSLISFYLGWSYDLIKKEKRKKKNKKKKRWGEHLQKGHQVVNVDSEGSVTPA